MQEPKTGKSRYKSRTIWFNIGTLLVSLGTQFAFLTTTLPVEYQIPVTITLGVFTAVGNVILRMVTKEPLE